MYQTVCETHAFRRAAIQAGLGDADIAAMIDYLASNPLAGDEMPGTGGCRKVRFAGRGKGKSGGYRTITFFTGETVPVFLITVFSKGVRSDLTKEERNKLRQVTKKIVSEYRNRVADAGAARGKTGRRA